LAVVLEITHVTYRKHIMSGMSSVNGNYSPQATQMLANFGVSTNGNNSSTEQILEELVQMLSQALQQLQGGQQPGTPSSPAAGAPAAGAPAAGAPASGAPAAAAPAGAAPAGAAPAGAAPAAAAPTGAGAGAAMNPQSASGAIAGYMGTNGNKSLDMNDIYKLSQGQAVGGNGQTPSPQVQQAAQYMMQNPSVYNQIETHDVSGADGKSSITNFQNAAQGDFPITAPSTGGASTAPATTPAPAAAATPAPVATPAPAAAPAAAPATTPAATTSTTPAMNEQSASGALAGYMGTNGNSALNVNDLYKLSLGQAAGGNGQTPTPQVQQAAQYMLSNPSTFNKIETNDVAGTDGNSGATNFENAAQGKV
jgi:hypothetical protein